MLTLLRGLLVALGLALAPVAHAVQPDEILADPALEARARALSAELRCLVCQNQSIDDSNAPLARDLRLLVRERLVAGDSDDAVRRFVVDRYGTFVLLKPPFDSRTLILWLAPALILAGASLLILRRAARVRRTRETQVRTLSQEEEAKLRALLAGSDGEAGKRAEPTIEKRRRTKS